MLSRPQEKERAGQASPWMPVRPDEARRAFYILMNELADHFRTKL
jgi:hypothetical protein